MRYIIGQASKKGDIPRKFDADELNVYVCEQCGAKHDSEEKAIYCCYWEVE